MEWIYLAGDSPTEYIPIEVLLVLVALLFHMSKLCTFLGFELILLYLQAVVFGIIVGFDSLFCFCFK